MKGMDPVQVGKATEANIQKTTISSQSKVLNKKISKFFVYSDE